MHSAEVYQQVARLHASNIDQGFLSSLGIPFLSLLYEAIDTNDTSLLLLAQHEGRVVGFVAGAEGMGPIYKGLLSQWPRLIQALLPALLSPRKLWKIGEVLLLGKKAPAVPNLPQAELISIAVDTEERGQGHASQLYEALVQHFRERKAKGFKIVVGDSLVSAHRFYQRMGALPVGRIEVHQGSSSVLYVHSLASGADSSA